MGPPWVTGAGVLTVLFFIIGFFFAPVWIIAGLLLVAFVAGLVLAAAGKSADSGGTAPDPVTGGRRWWQKRWDE
jgi:hypothetical protein